MISRKKLLNKLLSLFIVFSMIIPIIPVIPVKAAPDDLTRAAVYTAAEGNLARNGTPSAQVTNTWQTGAGNGTRALNNGVLGGNTIHDTTWNSLSDQNPVWTQIAWDQEQTIDSTRVMWACEGTSSNIRLPVSVIVQYWDGSAFQEVTNMRDPSGAAVTSVGCVGTYGPSTSNCSNMREWNAVTFDAVTTTQLRLVMTIQSGSQGTGIGEWEIFNYTGEAELRSASITGDNQIVMADSKVYAGNYTVSGLEGVTYEWTLNSPNAEIEGSNTNETVTVRGKAAGTANLGLTVRHDSGVLEATATMPITIVNISGSVTGPDKLYENVEGTYTSSVAAGSLTGITYQWSLSNANAQIIGGDTGNSITLKGVSAGPVDLSLTLSHAASGQQITIPKTIVIKDPSDSVEPYITATAAGRTPILPRRVVVNDVRFDTPTASLVEGSKNYDFGESFEDSLIPVVWNEDSFSAADYAVGKEGTFFTVTGVTAPDSRVPGLNATAIITVKEAMAAPDYNHSITSENVVFDDVFWKPKMDVNATETFDHAITQLERYNTNYTIRNFRNARSRLQAVWNGDNNPAAPAYTGYVFQDTDMYKTLEAFAYNLSTIWDDPAMQERKVSLQNTLDEWIGLVEDIQYADGYIGSHFSARSTRNNGTAGTHTGRPNPSMVHRWCSMAKHEMYNIGHFLEAAVAYTRYSVATGQNDYTLYEVGKRAADHIVNVFGPEGYRHEVPGHEEIELAMMKFAILVEEYEGVGTGQVYRDTVKLLIDRRGEPNRATVRESAYNAGSYSQDATPLRDETKAVGHAVRACYLYTGATDVAISLPDSDPDKAAYLRGIGNIYDSMSERNTYITGGLGSGESSEGFGPDYGMPAQGAYLETCSAIAGANWYQRLNLYYEDAKYADAYEKALYNGILTGVELNGKRFYYGTDLDSANGKARSDWMDCACCPPNLIRTIANIGGYMYTVNKDVVFKNLYGGNTANINVEGTNVNIKEESNYPWEGMINMIVKPDVAKSFTLNLRIPGWIKAQKNQQVTIKVNGEEIDATPSAKGYVAITRAWPVEGTEVSMDMPLEIRLTEPDDNVGATRDYSSTQVEPSWRNADNNLWNKVAIERGPLTYCAERAGLLNSTNTAASQVRVGRNDQLTATWNPDLLRGIVEIRGTMKYGTSDAATETQEVQFIPFYTKNNRGNNKGSNGEGANPNNGGSIRVWFHAVQDDYGVDIRGDKNRITAGETAELIATPKVNYAAKAQANNYVWTITEGSDVIEKAGDAVAGLTADSGYEKIGGLNGLTRPNSTANFRALKPGSAAVQVQMRNAANEVVATDTYEITVEGEVDPTTPPSISGPTALSLAEGYAATSSNVFSLGGATPIVVTQDTNHGGKITWNNSLRRLEIAAGLTIGAYPVVLTASNGNTPNATTTFTLTVTGAPPQISGINDMTLMEGYEATSTSAYNIKGTAPVTVSKTSGDEKITWNNDTKKLDIAEGLPVGTYPVVLTAEGSVAPSASLTFTLKVIKPVDAKQLYEDLVLYYIYDPADKGDDNKTVKDYSLKKNDGTIAGTPTAEQWTGNGYAIKAGNYISIPTTANLVGPNMTLVFTMLRTAAQSGNGSLFSGQQAWNSAFGIWMNTNGPYWAQSGGSTNLGDGGYPMENLWPVNRTREFAFSMSAPETGSGSGFYMIDGEKLTVAPPTNRIATPTTAQLTGGYRIGENSWNGESLTDATFSKHMIFNRGLTEDEVQAVYNGILNPLTVNYSIIGSEDAGTLTAKQANGNDLRDGGKAIKSTDVEFTVTPKSGYRVKEWNVDGAVKQSAGNTFTLSDLQTDVAVTVEFEMLELDKSALKAALDRAAEKINPPNEGEKLWEEHEFTVYTRESWYAFKAAEEAAGKVYNNDPGIPTQSEIEEATDKLNEAMDALLSYDLCDEREPLAEALEEAKKYDPSMYTIASFAKLQSAIELAEVRLADESLTFQERAEIINDLNEAIAGLNGSLLDIIKELKEAAIKAAEEAKADAEKAEEEAKEAAEAAETATTEAKNAKTEAEKAETEAGKAKTEAENALREAEKAKAEAEKAKAEADRAKSDAEKALEEAGKSEISRLAAEEAKEKAEEAKRAAEEAQGKAKEAEEKAEEAGGKAEEAQKAAETAKNDAEEAQKAAETAQKAAEISKDKAETARSAAETAATAAEASKAAAESAKDDAVAAKAAAEAARDEAVSAKNDAAAAKTAAKEAKDEAVSAKYEAIIAKTAAEAAKAAAEAAKADAMAARVQAEAARAGAEAAKADAIAARAEALAAKAAAQAAAAVAEKAKEEAEKAKQEAEKAKEDAEKAKLEAEKAKEDAEKAAAEAAKKKQEAEEAKLAAQKAQKAAEDALKAAQAVQAAVEAKQKGLNTDQAQEKTNDSLKKDADASTLMGRAVKINSAKNVKKKQILLKLKKDPLAAAYQIQCAANRKFKKSVKKTTAKVSYSIKSLKKGRTYYVRARAYTKDSKGKTVYGRWSKPKKVTVRR